MRRPADLEALRAHGRARVVEGALNGVIMHWHVCGHVRRHMLHFRACMDGTLRQVCEYACKLSAAVRLLQAS